MQDALSLTADGTTLHITAVAANILRLAVGERAVGGPTSYLPGAPPAAIPAADRVSVAPEQPGSTLVFRGADGRPLLRLAPGWISAAPATLRFELPGEQHLYGMGEGGTQFDRLGSARRLWNFQANRAQGADIAAPLFLSQAGYGVFIDNTARGRLEHGDADMGNAVLEYSAEAGGFDVYVIVGDMRAVLGDIAALLGRAAMPPRWALGYLQSTRHFDNTAEILALASEMRRRRLPCDAIIFLSTYGAAKGWNRGVGHLEFQPELFADPAAVLGALHAQHFRTFGHEYPVVHAHSPAYGEARAKGYLLDHAYPGDAAAPVAPAAAAVYREGQVFIDFSQSDARAWWWHAHRDLVAQGIAGWWLDGGEGPPEGVALAAGGSEMVHNRFDLWRQQSFAEGEARDRPEQRPFLLCRSGGPGMARFGAIPWSGDINTTFETMETQIRIGLNLSLSGIPHWGTDAGGFYSVAPDDGELFVRWLQFSAFCTLFRAHGHVWRRHVPWAHGEVIETICREIIELRMRMMPYVYTIVWHASRDGLPTMRPLVLNYPHDPNVWDLGSQYLFGDDLLVAPVTRRGATHWTVYLPAGTWHDYWTNASYHGPGGVTVPAPLGRSPLFVRAGAIIPLGPVVQYDGEAPCDEITLLVYPEGESSFTLYEDDGVTNAYRDGVHAETRFDCVADAVGVSFVVHAPTGVAALVSAGRRYTLKLRAAKPPAAVSHGEGWLHDGVFLIVRLPAQPATTRVTW